MILERRSFVEEALNLIVNKMFEMGFSDDNYRNRSEGSKVAGLQYYCKQEKESEWEVYATYNPSLSMLSLHYHHLGTVEKNSNNKDYSYPVFFVHVANTEDAYTACKLLEMKTDYLWKNPSPVTIPNETINSTLRKLGCTFHKRENNISKWIYGKKAILIENGVKLSAYMFDVVGNNSKPVMAIRNIHEEGSWKEVEDYLRRKILE